MLQKTEILIDVDEINPCVEKIFQLLNRAQDIDFKEDNMLNKIWEKATNLKIIIESDKKSDSEIYRRLAVIKNLINKYNEEYGGILVW